jgi:hypothetical protein
LGLFKYSQAKFVKNLKKPVNQIHSSNGKEIKKGKSLIENRKQLLLLEIVEGRDREERKLMRRNKIEGFEVGGNGNEWEENSKMLKFQLQFPMANYKTYQLKYIDQFHNHNVHSSKIAASN